MIGRYGPPIFQICRGLQGAYNVALMKAKPKPIVRNEYLFYLLSQARILEYVESLSLRTGGQTGVDLEALRNFPTLLPSAKYQQKVEEILCALDVKIENNNRICEELQAFANLFYDHWFLQFDFPCMPQQASLSDDPDLVGKPYRSAGGEMVYAKALNREIPMGWEVSTIGRTFVTLAGGTPTRKNERYWSPAEVNWLSSGENPDLFVLSPNEKISELGLQESTAKLLPAGSVILSIVRYLRASILGIPAATNQSVVGILETGTLKNCFIYPCLVRELPRLMALRTGAQQPHINKGVLDESLIVIPDKETLRSYTDLVAPMFEKTLVYLRQNKLLAELRDWLLPMLMNGQVRVS